MTNNIKIRESISNDTEVKKLLENTAAGKSILANVFGIQGMGKDFFLNEFFIPLLESKDILHFKPETSISMETMLSYSNQIAVWVYSKILVDKNRKIKKDLNSPEELEKIYLDLRKDLKEEKNKKNFAILVNDVSNLPFDDLDWFQSVVLDSISSSPNSIIVVTSQNELNWHSWEMRNKCISIKLPIFTQEEIAELCKSFILAEKINYLSAGHPQTVVDLIQVAKENINKKLHEITEKDIEINNALFYKKLEEGINVNLNFEGREWLKKVFMLTSAIEGFDADLVGDIVNAFKETDFKDSAKVLEEITDVAWEMAYTGLASWDFEEKTYKMVPELRERVLKFMEYSLKNDVEKVFFVVAETFLLRSEFLPDKEMQLAKYIYYYTKALILDGKKNQIAINVKQEIESRIENTNDIQRLISILDTIFKNAPVDLYETYKEIVNILDVLPMSPLIVQPEQKQGKNMNITTSSLLPKVKETSAKEIKAIFNSLITHRLGTKKILTIQGQPGIGKSYLINDLINIAKEEVVRKVCVIDLNSPPNRHRVSVLEKIVDQLELNRDINVSESMNLISGPKKISQIYMGINEKETFEVLSLRVVEAIGKSLEKYYKKENQPVIFIDTYDDNPSVNQLSSWLFESLIPNIQNNLYLVIAGQKSPLSVKDITQETIEKIEITGLSKLTDDEIHELILQKDIKDLTLNPELIKNIVRISDRVPLIIDWILFYLRKFGQTDQWSDIVSSPDKESALRKISQQMWSQPNTTAGSSAAIKAFQAAVHFGQHFNLELFKSVISENELGGVSHKVVFEDLAKNYFYTRGNVENWTLHEHIRFWMREVSKEQANVKRYMEISRKALDNYYYPKLQLFYDNYQNLTQEEESHLNDLEAESYFHQLYIEAKPNNHNTTDELYSNLWEHLDRLWHRYRLEQMTQLVHYGREVQNWRLGAEKDFLLTSILDAAQSWAHYSESDYQLAEQFANHILNRERAPKRLKATAKVILGLLPSQNPEYAIKNYLTSAKLDYQQILSQMIDGKLPNNEFTDSEENIYIEIHQILMGIGQIQLTHSFDLDKGEEAFQEAKEIAQSKAWKDPLYVAAALNGLARVLRFRGEFSDALNKVMSAISIYKIASGITENDVNLAYFSETLGLIYKELEEYKLAHDSFDKSLEIYGKIVGPMEVRKATVRLEKGHVYLLEQKFEDASKLINDSFNIFNMQKDKYRWYYLNSLNKLGELQRKTNDIKSARETFNEQKNHASTHGHELWEYWAKQQIAEIDYDNNSVYNKQELLNMLLDYSQTRGRKFGPAFWRTNYLLYRIAKEKENNNSEGIRYLAEGLTHLATNWKSKFWRNLTILRTELLELDVKDLSVETEHLIRFWKNKFPDNNPEPRFITMCEDLKRAIENIG